MPDKIPLLVVVGPTASGKTALAVELAKRLGGEVVSADSMQIYKGMQIGTAKPTEEEMQGIPHHLIDFLSPDEQFSVADYLRLARKVIEEITTRGNLPILCGGTGLYVSSLVDHLQFENIQSDLRLRRDLEQRAKKEGGQVLLKELAVVDPALAQTLHPHNLGRIIRAIEVYRLTGIPMSEQQKRARREPSPYAACILGISFQNRRLLYERINARVDEMLRQGLVEEAENFYAQPHAGTAVQAIGYKELLPYLQGKIALEEASEHLKMQTRRYAKRQLTWFRKDERVHWLYYDLYPDHESFVKDALDIWKKSECRATIETRKSQGGC